MDCRLFPWEERNEFGRKKCRLSGCFTRVINRRTEIKLAFELANDICRRSRERLGVERATVCVSCSINGMKILVEDASKRNDVIGNTNKQDPDFPRIISGLNTKQKIRNSLFLPRSIEL